MAQGVCQVAIFQSGVTKNAGGAGVQGKRSVFKVIASLSLTGKRVPSLAR